MATDDERMVEVTVVVLADGVEIDRHTQSIPAWAVDHVAVAAIVQIQDPDLQGAEDALHGPDMEG